MGVPLIMAGQKVLDVHTDPAAGAGAGSDTKEQAQEKTKSYQFKYTTLPGYFLQDDPRTPAEGFQFMNTNFGLVERPYDSDESLPDHGQGQTSWRRFEHHITSLNHAAAEPHLEREDGAGARYKLIFLGRHGNGYHNIAERYYGGEAWDCHFSTLDGDPDGIMTWSDAHLSEEGRRQAAEVNTFWKSQIKDQEMSLPEAYFVSPLDRAMETAEITFQDLLGPTPNSQPIVMERLREGTGIHTCDRRSSVSQIRQRYPTSLTNRDPLLTETDEFWDATLREPDDALTGRLGKLLDAVLESPQGDESERISFTSHSGAIGAILRVLGHRPFALGTGAVIPVFLKVDKIPRGGPPRRRHGGDAEGGRHAHVDDDGDEGDDSEHDSVDALASDRSKWKTKPSCPAGMDLVNIGRERWGMGLKEYLAGVENGTVKVDEVAFAGVLN